jgi:hypothetical protein
VEGKVMVAGAGRVVSEYSPFIWGLAAIGEGRNGTLKGDKLLAFGEDPVEDDDG